MLLIRRIARNSLWLVVSRLLSQGLLLLFSVLVARYLGEARLGQYAFIAAVVFVGNVFTTFGMDTLLIREIAGLRSTDTPTLTAALLIQLALSLLFIVALLLGAGLLPNQTPETRLALKLYSLSLLPLAFSTVYSAVLRAYERMDLYLLFNVATALFQTVGALIVVVGGGQLIALILLLLAAQTAGALTAALLCVRYLPAFTFNRRITRLTIWQTLRAGWPLASLVVLAVIYQRMGVFTLSLLTNDATTGWFSAAARIAEAFKMIPYAFFGALFPVMARVAFRANNKHTPADRGHLPAQKGLYDRSFIALIAFAIIAALSITVLAAPLIDLLYGASYAPATVALRILVWGLIPFAVTLKISFELVSSGQEKIALRAMMLTVGVAVVLFVVLTQRSGLPGACWATVGAEAVQAVILLLLARGNRQMRPLKISNPFLTPGRRDGKENKL